MQARKIPIYSHTRSWNLRQLTPLYFADLSCVSISSRVFPLVSGTRKYAKSQAPMLTAPYSQNVMDFPKTCVSVKNDRATSKFALQLAVVPTLMARPRIRSG